MLRTASAVLLALASSYAVEQQWVPMPLLTAAQAADGLAPGGEGCQYPCSLECDAVDGGTLLYGTDVGGIFRSSDGAKSWAPADLGWKANGAIDFAFDPRNPDRVLAVGTLSGNQAVQSDGLYLSLDRGRSWSQVLAVPRIELSHDHVTMLAYDPASFDAGTKRCRTVYCALQASPNRPAGLYRSDDGGAIWMLAAQAESYAGAEGRVFVAVPGADGALLVASPGGVFRSADRGETFTRVLGADGGELEGLATVASAPNTAWVARGAALLRSDDGGRTFAPVPQDGVVRRFARISVSPADPLRIATRDREGDERCISHDGGRTWKRAVALHDAKEFFADDVRTGFRDRNLIVAWHPTDKNVAWATGPGDLLWRSDDGGLTFRWANNGINNIMTGGLFNFAANAPDTLYVGSQDYNGGLTTDGGRTWRFVNLTVSYTRGAVRPGGDDSDSWGWVYGGYTPDGTILYGGNREFLGKREDLWISFDGGRTSERKVEGLSGAQVSYSDPRDGNVLFCWGWMSRDQGRTWAKMAGCDGVFTASAGADRALYGRDGARIVRSADHGRTWVSVGELPKPVRDVAVDHVTGALWAAAEDNTLYRVIGGTATAITALPKDHFGHGMVASTVAIDPIDPRIVYVGALGTGLWVQRDATVARSLDGGATWERLTCNPAYLADGWVTGGQMTGALRVHPTSRWLYAATCCYGWWRFPPPPAEAVGKPVVDRAYAPPLPTAAIAQVPDRSRPAPGADGLAVKVARDFAASGFEYTYGESWKDGETVRSGEVDGRRCLIVDATEHGGGGVVLGGVPLAPQGENALVVTLRPLAGNAGEGLSANIDCADGSQRSVAIDLRGLPADRFSNVIVPLPGAPGDYARVKQIQIQGTDWSPAARRLHVAIARIGTVVR